MMIRAHHPHAFRSKQWATVLAVEADPWRNRECFFVQFPDGVIDYWPVNDQAHQYEFDTKERPS